MPQAFTPLDGRLPLPSPPQDPPPSSKPSLRSRETPFDGTWDRLKVSPKAPPHILAPREPAPAAAESAHGLLTLFAGLVLSPNADDEWFDSCASPHALLCDVPHALGADAAAALFSPDKSRKCDGKWSESIDARCCCCCCCCSEVGTHDCGICAGCAGLLMLALGAWVCVANCLLRSAS